MEDWKSKFEELKEENFNYVMQLVDMSTKNDALQQQVEGLQKQIQTITAHKDSLVQAVKDLTSCKSTREQSENELLRVAKELQNSGKEMERIHQQHLSKKSTEIQTQKRCFNMLKNAAGYDPGQVDKDITILNTVGTSLNGCGANSSTVTDAKPKRLNVEDLKKLLPPSSLFNGDRRNKYRQFELPWIAKVFINLRKKYKKPTGNYLKKVWKDFEDDLKNIGRTKQTFLRYYMNGTGRRDLKIVIDQIKMGYDPSICGPAKLEKSKTDSSDSDSD